MARRRSTTHEPVYDPAFGDRHLAEAVQDILLGRWEGARDLLAQQPRTDFDRRSHRIRLLADAAAGHRTADTWHAAEPNNPDAAVLFAETEVMRQFAAARGGATPAQDDLFRVIRTCLRAAELAPADPQPWVSLVTVARLHPGGHPQTVAWWREVTRRDPLHRDGHHQVLRHLSARWHGSHAEAANFAWDVAAAAPDGSPLLALPVVARAEQYRQRLAEEARTAVGLSLYWTADRAHYDLRLALDRWIAPRTVEYAQDVADLNHLAHGLCHAELLPEAAHLFGLLGHRATTIPWSSTGEPEQQFALWRERALASVSRPRR